MIGELKKQRSELEDHLREAVISDTTIETVQSLSAEVRSRRVQAQFDEKRWLIETLDVQG